VLTRVNDPADVEDTQGVRIAPDVTLHGATLPHKEPAEREEARVALYVHGSGTVGNYTIVERPPRWLMDRRIYDSVILPDGRGCGSSSPWTGKPTIRDQARDMQALLDALESAQAFQPNRARAQLSEPRRAFADEDYLVLVPDLLRHGRSSTAQTGTTRLGESD
jgi:pimeloyl-ACP methyl ester carboxylesterase